MSFLEALLDFPKDWRDCWRIDAAGQIAYRAPPQPDLVELDEFIGEELARFAEAEDERQRRAEEEARKAEAKAEADAAAAEAKAAEEAAEAAAHHKEEKKELHEMSNAELASIASNCNAKALNYVIKKGGENALINALANPAIDSDQVCVIVEKRSPSTSLLTAIGRSRFASDKNLAAALCKNNKTPLFMSRGLLKRLNSADLREVSRMPQLPQQLKMQARRALDKKRR